jgi:hypothetical protein
VRTIAVAHHLGLRMQLMIAELSNAIIIRIRHAALRGSGWEQRTPASLPEIAHPSDSENKGVRF